jgi:hypothetical protein
MRKPSPKCTLPGCKHYASHGQRCSHVDCPCRKQVTAQPAHGRVTSGTDSSSLYAIPTQRTDREYD